MKTIDMSLLRHPLRGLLICMVAGALALACSSSNNNPKPDGGAGTGGSSTGHGGTTGGGGNAGAAGRPDHRAAASRAPAAQPLVPVVARRPERAAVPLEPAARPAEPAAVPLERRARAAAARPAPVARRAVQARARAARPVAGGTTGAGGSQPGCFPGTPADRQPGSKDYLNRCTGNGCFPFNNTQRVPNWDGGAAYAL